MLQSSAMCTVSSRKAEVTMLLQLVEGVEQRNREDNYENTYSP